VPLGSLGTAQQLKAYLKVIGPTKMLVDLKTQDFLCIKKVELNCSVLMREAVVLLLFVWSVMANTVTKDCTAITSPRGTYDLGPLIGTVYVIHCPTFLTSASRRVTICMNLRCPFVRMAFLVGRSA
jgi:hypothetical protein